MRQSSRILSGALLGAAIIAAGCSSPREKYEKCAAKYEGAKSSFTRRIMLGLCEKKAYGELDQSKLKSLCESDNDHHACARWVVATGPADKAEIARVLGGRCDAKMAMACHMLGKIYNKGKLLPKDKTKGYALLEKGCQLGNAISCASPALNYMRTRETKDYKKAFALLSIGCAAKDYSKYSCGLLGVLYRDGKGIGADRKKAALYLGKACTKGLKMSCRALRRL